MESAKWYIGRMHARERAQKSAERRARLQASSRNSSICAAAQPSPQEGTWPTSSSFECPSPTDSVSSTKSDQLAALDRLRVPKWSPGDVAAPLSPSSVASDEAAEAVARQRTNSQHGTALEILERVAATG